MPLIKVLLLIALFVFSAIAQADTQTLEARYAKFSQLEVSEQPPLRIRLSGQILHSALLVSGMQVEKEEDSMTILVSLSLVSSLPWNKNRRSDFSYDLEIPAAVNTVFFGREKQLIWTRANGIMKTCTSAQAKAAEESITTLQTWNEVHQSFQRYSHCDDGAIWEAYDEVIDKLLAEHWDTLPALQAIIDHDRHFEAFVLKHIDDLLGQEQAIAIRESATQNCPHNAGRLCTGILKAVGQQ